MDYEHWDLAHSNARVSGMPTLSSRTRGKMPMAQGSRLCHRFKFSQSGPYDL